MNTMAQWKYKPARLVMIFLMLLLPAGCGETPLPRRYDGEGNLLAPPAKKAPAWNVVLISIDTLRADHLGCYGYERPVSPNMDRLAEEGVLFQETLSPSPWTTPSHISLMTSLYPSVHKVYEYPYPGSLDPEGVTLAEILKQQGCRTAGFTEGGYVKKETGLGDGFEAYPDWPGDGQSYISHELSPSRLIENANRALKWLDEKRQDRFFLFFHTYEPHFEYRPPLEYLRKINPSFSPQKEISLLRAAVSRWDDGASLSPGEKGILYRHYLQGDLSRFPLKRRRQLLAALADFSRKEWKSSPSFEEDLRCIIDLYDAEILFTDEAVGRLLEKLRSLGILEKTLVVLTSDHGEGLMDHGIVHHGKNLYEELLKVPLIIRFPGGRHGGKRISPLARTLDIMPTILDCLGLPTPRDAQGVSLAPLIQGKTFSSESMGEALSVHKAETAIVSLRREAWKYVLHSGSGREELYNLEEDRGERVDLSRRFSSVAEEFRKRLKALRKKNRKEGENYRAGEKAFSEKDRKRLEELGYVIK